MKAFRRQKSNVIENAARIKSAVKILAIFCLVWVAQDVRASVLLSYGSSSYATADVTFGRTATVTGSAGNYTEQNAFSDTVALSPSTGYSGLTFYGGYLYTISGTSNTVSGITRQQIRNDVARDGTNSYDLIYLQDYNASGWSGATFSVSAIYVFQLGAASNISSISAAISNNSTNTNFKSGASWRWVIKVGSAYYLSQTTFANTGWAATTTTISSLSGASWAVYDPTANLNFNQSSATFSAIDTSSVSAVGLYLEDDSWAGDSGTQSFDFMVQSFVVNGTMIPEPKMKVLLFFGILLLSSIRVFLKKSCTSLS